MSLSGIEQWLLEQIVPVFFVGFALLAGLALLYFSAQSKKAARRRDRAWQDESTFAEKLAAHGFDAEDRAERRTGILRSGTRAGFPLLPADDLDRDLGMDRDDVREALRERDRAGGAGLSAGPGDNADCYRGGAGASSAGLAAQSAADTTAGVVESC